MHPMGTNGYCSVTFMFFSARQAHVVHDEDDAMDAEAGENNLSDHEVASEPIASVVGSEPIASVVRDWPAQTQGGGQCKNCIKKGQGVFCARHA